MKIIDGHVHLVQCIAGTGASGAMRAIGGGKGMYDDGTVFALIPPSLGEYEVTPEAVLKVFDENNVEKGVLLQGNFIGFQNLYSYDAMRKYPDRFLAAAAYDPYSRKRDEIIHHLFEDLGINVVKFEVSTSSGLMGNHRTLPLDGELMEKEYAYADEHELIFTIDIGKLGSESSQIPALRNAILRHPHLKFVVCHLLAPKQHMKQEMLEGLEALHLPNVWFDIASLSSNVRPDTSPDFPVTRSFLSAAIEAVGADRLIFGTDLPSTLIANSYADLAGIVIDNPAFSREQKEMIMYQNANHVYFRN